MSNLYKDQSRLREIKVVRLLELTDYDATHLVAGAMTLPKLRAIREYLLAHPGATYGEVIRRVKGCGRRVLMIAAIIELP
jgi:hypothetical protein